MVDEIFHFEYFEVVFHWRLSSFMKYGLVIHISLSLKFEYDSIKGCWIIPLLIFWGCLQLEVVFNWRLSSIRGHLRLKNLYNIIWSSKIKFKKFPLTPMGVLAPVSAQRDTPLSPPSTSAEIFRRTCLQSSLKKPKKFVGGGQIFKKNNSDQLSRQIRQF